uniref:Sidekick n=1 Tax=Panagrolaimus davidi TaxID=227884 RepID=A0A914QBI7_9BILA
MLSDEYSSRTDLWTTWTRNGIEIPATGDAMRRISINGGNLIINSVGPDSIGLYSCKVRSVNGEEESSSGWLKIIEKPSMPINVHATLVNDTVPAKIRVSWRPGFDGNSPIIRHKIEMRTFGTTTNLWSEWETIIENVPSELNESLIDNIKPSSTAEFRVISFNKYGPGKASRNSENITMPQQPPAAAPRNVVASARSSNSIMVQWQPPPPELFNGEILGYVIRYKLAGYASVDWNEKNISNANARNSLIENLIQWKEYEFQIAAFNERGLGVFSKPYEVITLEGQPMQAPQNVHVQVINSTAIKLSFDPPDQQLIPGVNLGYKIEIWKGPAHFRQPYRTVKVLPELTRIDEEIGNLEKFGHYNITTLCYTSPGDGPSSDPIEVITDEDIPGPVASIDFDQVMSDSVLLKWEPPTEPNGILLTYIIRHWEDEKPEEKFTSDIDATKNELTIDKLKPSTKYSIDIQAVTKVGPGPRVEAKFESGVPPELPGKPTSLGISDIGPRSVVLQFVPGFDGHSFIKKWHVEACIGTSSIFTEIFNISAPKARSFIVEGLRPYTTYKLRLIAENVRGRGGPSDSSRVFQTRQTEPENSPEKLFAEPISDNQISLVWTPLMSSHWNGDPSGYLIQYRATSGNKNDNETSLEANDGFEWKEIRASNPKASELTLTGLRPYTSYQIKIYSENTFGKSRPSETVFTTTYESVPSGAPTNVEAELDVTKHSVIVSWNDVEEKHRNGIIMGYIVRMVPDEAQLRQSHTRQVEVIGSEQHLIKIENLRSFTEYRIFVVAFTIVGEGPQNSDPPLIVTPEAIPEEPSRLVFDFTNSNEVRFKWMPPVNSNGKILAYEIRQWKFGQEKDAATTKVPYSVFGFSANNLTPNTTYLFGVKAETSVGWGPEEIAAIYTSGIKNPPPVPPAPRQHSSKPPTANEIWIEWNIKKYNNRELNFDDAPVRWISLEFRKENDEKWTTYLSWLSPNKNEFQFTHLSPNTAYSFRIRFTGDLSDGVWSAESEWIKTLEAAPSLPPQKLQASPYESSSIMLQFNPPERHTWNSLALGYRILYRVYPSNETFKAIEIPPSEELPTNNQIQHLIQKLASFHHYVVQVQSFNSYGNSIPSRPTFVYVGYSIPKQRIKNLIAEPLSSTSIKIRWDEWQNSDDDVISGYRVRYAPLLSVMSEEIENEAMGGESTEEIVISERNEIILTDLRKYQEYQISVAGYNRAGEGQSTPIRIRTLEDFPGPVGELDFHDILLDSVNVSWSPPQQPNGRILNYIVHFRTYKLAVGYQNEVTQKTSLNYYLATNLEENSTYFFTIQAENSAGPGVETFNNVTIGYNVGAPDSPSKPTFASEPSSFILYWKDGLPGKTPIIGYVIQAKRVGVVSSNNPSSSPTFEPETIRRRAKRHDSNNDDRPQHVIGEWLTISNVMGADTEYRISYRQLTPSSIYVFRVFARNRLGIGLPSTVSDELIVPATIPDDPFYNKWWFIAAVGGLIFIVVFIFIILLCVTNGNKRYKGDKRPSFDSLQLADGGIVSYELRQSKNKHVRSEIPPRPDTHTSWISNEQIRDPLGYGSIASGVDGVGGSRANSVYRALATDQLPNRHGSSSYAPYSTGIQNVIGGGGYASRTNLTDSNQQKSPVYRLADYGTSHLVNDRNFPYNDEEYGERKDNNEEEDDEANASTDNFARHYQVANGNEDIYRATWRRTKEQAQQQQAQQLRSPLPPPPPPAVPISRPPKLSEMSANTSISDSSSQTNGLAPGISLRALFPQNNNHSDRNSSSAGHQTPLAGASSINGFSSFV